MSLSVLPHRLALALGFALAAPLTSAPAQAAAPTGTPEQRAAALVAQMSREEKVAQAMNAAPAIPRLGIPAYEWWNEGLHGVARNGYATVFPQAIGLAASWNTQLMQQVGTVVSTEARAKFNQAGGPGKDHKRYAGLTIWSPNINIFRDPRWGRGMETYGEDPFLTGQLAVGFIRGLQGDDLEHPRTIATPKHIAVHSGPEPGRHGFDVDVSPRDVEATYTPAFRAALVEGQAGSVMCAYNSLHGTPACAADWLLNGRVRGDWGFKGFVVSDCDAVDDMTQFHYFRPDNAGSSAAALKAGHDLNCGTAYRALGTAIERGEVDEALLDQSLVRLFAARYRLGELQAPRKGPLRQARRQGHRQRGQPCAGVAGGGRVDCAPEERERHAAIEGRHTAGGDRPQRRCIGCTGSQLPRHLIAAGDAVAWPASALRRAAGALRARRATGRWRAGHDSGDCVAQRRQARAAR